MLRFKIPPPGFSQPSALQNLFSEPSTTSTEAHSKDSASKKRPVAAAHHPNGAARGKQRKLLEQCPNTSSVKFSDPSNSQSQSSVLQQSELARAVSDALAADFNKPLNSDGDAIDNKKIEDFKQKLFNEGTLTKSSIGIYIGLIKKFQIFLKELQPALPYLESLRNKPGTEITSTLDKFFASQKDPVKSKNNQAPALRRYFNIQNPSEILDNKILPINSALITHYENNAVKVSYSEKKRFSSNTLKARCRQLKIFSIFLQEDKSVSSLEEFFKSDKQKVQETLINRYLESKQPTPRSFTDLNQAINNMQKTLDRLPTETAAN